MTNSIEPIVNNFHTDEDVHGNAIAIARSEYDVRIITTNDAGLRRARDEVHFDFVIEHGLVFVTGNIEHFRPMFKQWNEEGKDHYGVVYISKEYRKNILLIAETMFLLSNEPMLNREEWVRL